MNGVLWLYGVFLALISLIFFLQILSYLMNSDMVDWEVGPVETSRHEDY